MARIMIADDNPMIARLVAAKLKGQGYEVDVVTDGTQAMEVALKSPPDLCILDVMMPGMDGFEVLHALREDPRFKSIPIILLTSLGEDSHSVRAFREGASDYVVKPFSPSELMARVERLLAH